MADSTRQATKPLMLKEVDMHGQRYRHQWVGSNDKTADSVAFGFRRVHFIAYVPGLRTRSIFNRVRVRVRVHKKFASPSSSSLNFNFSSSSSSSQNRVEKIQSE